MDGKQTENIREGIQDVLEDNHFSRIQAANLADACVDEITKQITEPIPITPPPYIPGGRVFERIFASPFDF